jgi:hypothetical protein
MWRIILPAEWLALVRFYTRHVLRAGRGSRSVLLRMPSGQRSLSFGCAALAEDCNAKSKCSDKDRSDQKDQY